MEDNPSEFLCLKTDRIGEAMAPGSDVRVRHNPKIVCPYSIPSYSQLPLYPKLVPKAKGGKGRNSLASLAICLSLLDVRQKVHEQRVQ